MGNTIKTNSQMPEGPNKIQGSRENPTRFFVVAGGSGGEAGVPNPGVEAEDIDVG